MKKLIAFISACYALAFAIVSEPAVVHAQTITFNSVLSPKFCGGDALVVSFTANGQFKRKNTFTLQLSNENGSFQSGFRNLASIYDSLPGNYTITTAIPTDVKASGSYRFRILGTVPYIASPDNGNNISVGELPWLGGIQVNPFRDAVVPNKPVDLELVDWYDSLSTTATYQWDLGPDAVPPTATGTSVKNVVFLTGGDKVISVTATSQQGCTNMAFKTIKVLDCFPHIPKDAIVVAEDGFSGPGSSTYWVNPGVTFNAAGSCTIFAEPGSTITTQGSCLIYLKRGASLLSTGGSCTVIAESGSSVPGSINLDCSGMEFDYSDAPPNIIMPLAVAGVAEQELAVFPNPSHGVFTVTGIPADATEISILNMLGTSLARYEHPGAGSLQIDLAHVQAGSYYLRIATSTGVVTKKVSIR